MPNAAAFPIPSSRSACIARAFARRECLRLEYAESTGTAVLLHGHCIARWTGPRSYTLSLAGYDTRTTRRYLNAISRALGEPVGGIYREGGETKMGLAGHPMASNREYSFETTQPPLAGTLGWIYRL